MDEIHEPMPRDWQDAYEYPPDRLQELRIQRDREIRKMYLTGGYTLAAIGVKHGLTRERVRQICDDLPAVTKISVVRRKIDSHINRIIRSERNIFESSYKFWSNVERAEPEQCWIWNGPRYPLGYGRFVTSAFGRRSRYAHRLSFFFANGRWPEQWVLHKCNNPPCVNPSHLYEGSPRQNHADAVRAHGQWWIKKGESSPHSILTKEEAVSVINLRWILTGPELAQCLGVSTACIYSIWSGNSWAHLPRSER